MAAAEIEGQQTADPAEIAHGQRLVETVLRPERCQGVGPRIGAQHHQRRIARQDFYHREHHDVANARVTSAAAKRRRGIQASSRGRKVVIPRRRPRDLSLGVKGPSLRSG